MKRLLILLSVFIPLSAHAECVMYLRPYGIAATIGFCLQDTDGTDYIGVHFENAASFAAGDAKITKNEGTAANTAALPVNESPCTSQAFTATEMQAARIVYALDDQTATAEWAAFCAIIDTYGFDGTAQAGGAKTITLAATASSVNDFYAGQYVKITAGTGAGQVRRIMSYTGSTRLATVNRKWATNPDSTSVYELGSNDNVKVDAFGATGN